MTVVAVHHFGKELVLSGKQTIRYVYHDFPNLPHARSVEAEAFALWCHGYEWKVKLYPGGHVTSNTNTVFVSVFLECLSAERAEEVKATVEFLVTSASFSCKTEAHLFRSPHLSWGLPNFISRADVLDPTKGFLVDENFTLDVTIQVHQDRAVFCGKQRSTLLIDMRNLLESAADSGDRKFTVGNQSFSAHLSILKARAPVLAELADDYSADTSIPIQGDTTPQTFRAFLRYLYCDELPASEEFKSIAIELLNVADRFGCRGLKLAAETEIVAKGITVDTAADLLLLGDAKKCALLKEAAIDFFVANSPAVMKSEGWAKVTKSVDLVTEVLAAVVADNTTRPLDNKKKRDYDQMRVSTLHEELEERGLDIDGSREILIGRLKEARI